MGFHFSTSMIDCIALKDSYRRTLQFIQAWRALRQSACRVTTAVDDDYFEDQWWCIEEQIDLGRDSMNIFFSVASLLSVPPVPIGLNLSMQMQQM